VSVQRSLGFPVGCSDHMVEWSKKSCGLPVVLLQEAAQSLFAAHLAIAGTHPLFSCRKEQNIFFTLMVSFSMAVLGERRYRSPQ
jgi:hypothetical protein